MQLKKNYSLFVDGIEQLKQEKFFVDGKIVGKYKINFCGTLSLYRLNELLFRNFDADESALAMRNLRKIALNAS